MLHGPAAFRIDWEPQERVVRVSGEIDLAVGRELSAAFARIPAGSEVVVDVAGVTFIDPTGMAKIVHGRRWHRIVLRGVSERMALVLEITGLGEALPSAGTWSVAGLLDRASLDDASRRPSAAVHGRRHGAAAPRTTIRRVGAHLTSPGMPRATERPVDARRAVTFRCTTEATYAVLVAEFTDWAAAPIPMHRRADGFEVTVALEPGRYRYKYLLDGERWVNDLVADAYEENEFGGYDSVREV